MSRVAVVRCSSYELEEVRTGVRRGVELLGGAAAFARRGEKILLKPNLLAADPPEKCVTTHPMVFRAVAELFAETGASLSFGDSPTLGNEQAACKRAGLAGPAAELGLEFKEFRRGREVYFEKGRQNRKFTIAEAVLDSDGIISLPKLKAHGFARFTGCIKNQFGCIPGLRKAEFHFRTPDPVDFARMLVDVDTCVRPRLYVMDGIMAMEGNGPRGGMPRAVNVLLFSVDPVACDATACRLIALDPFLVPAIRLGQEAGRGTARPEEIELTGDPVDSLVVKDFAVDRSAAVPTVSHGRAKRLLNALLVPKPLIDAARCVRCGQCVTVCPVTPKAVDWAAAGAAKPPVHDYRRCIRCYCCQEICPEKAIKLQQPLLRRLFRL